MTKEAEGYEKKGPFDTVSSRLVELKQAHVSGSIRDLKVEVCVPFRKRQTRRVLRLAVSRLLILGT